jgi:hypothetical protein
MLTSLPTVNLNRLTVQVAGFGKTGTGVSSRYMETVEMKIMPIRECENRIWKLQNRPQRVTINYLCGISNPAAFLNSVRSI